MLLNISARMGPGIQPFHRMAQGIGKEILHAYFEELVFHVNASLTLSVNFWMLIVYN